MSNVYMEHFEQKINKNQIITTIHNIFTANPKTIITIMYKIFSTNQPFAKINATLFSKSLTYKINIPQHNFIKNKKINYYF